MMMMTATMLLQTLVEPIFTETAQNPSSLVAFLVEGHGPKGLASDSVREFVYWGAELVDRVPGLVKTLFAEAVASFCDAEGFFPSSIVVVIGHDFVLKN